MRAEPRLDRKASGVDVKELMAMTDRFGTIDRERAGGAGYQVLDGDAWIEQEVDILVPAALEHQITAGNAGRIHSGAVGPKEALAEPCNSAPVPLGRPAILGLP